jgi:hypothetical protein
MMAYKRLTFRHKSVVDGTEQIGYTERIAGCYRASDMILDRLAELEDKIEQGTLIEKEVVELFAESEEKFRSKAKFYYERCKSYGIENFYDAELEQEED